MKYDDTQSRGARDARSPGAPEGDRAPGRAVLVIDDDEAIRDALAQVLTEDGYLVATADNGQTGLEKLRNGVLPSVILLDLMMPVMDGRAFLAARRADAKLAAVPVIIVTADARAMQEASTLDAQAILNKPLSLAILLETVAAFCRR